MSSIEDRSNSKQNSENEDYYEEGEWEGYYEEEQSRYEELKDGSTAIETEGEMNKISENKDIGVDGSFYKREKEIKSYEKQEPDEEKKETFGFQNMQFTKVELKPLRVEIKENDKKNDSFSSSNDNIPSHITPKIDFEIQTNSDKLQQSQQQILPQQPEHQNIEEEILKKYTMSGNSKMVADVEAFLRRKFLNIQNDTKGTEKDILSTVEDEKTQAKPVDYNKIVDFHNDFHKNQDQFFPPNANHFIQQQNLQHLVNKQPEQDFPTFTAQPPQQVTENQPQPQSNQPIVEDKMIFSDSLISSVVLPEDALDDRYTKIDKTKHCFLDVFATNTDLKQLCMMRPDMESLSISNCNMIYEFDCIKKLQYLKEFEARNCQLLTNLDCIAEARDLRVLNIASSGVTNIDVVANLRNLEVFNCAACKILDIKALKYCPKLIEVVLWGCMSVSDIDSLGFCQDLRCLDLDFIGVSDLFPLVNNRKLEFLNLDNCEKIKDLAPFAALHNLKVLTMEGNSIIMERQLENIGGLRELRYLNLKDRKINNSSLLEGLTNLEELILAGSTFSNVSPLAKLVNLTVLDFSANSSVKNINSLHTLTKIKKFLISGGGNIRGLREGDKFAAGKSQMEIEDVDVIGNFTKMTVFNSSNNPRIKEINAIKNCKNLEEVYLARCTGLEDVSALGSLTNLINIDLTSCPKIKELYFLSNLPKLLSLMFNGTIVYSPSFLSNWKKSTGMFALVGNDSDMLSKNFLVSAKKKVKLQKVLKNVFTVKK